jgi:hypothetical protein
MLTSQSRPLPFPHATSHQLPVILQKQVESGGPLNCKYDTGQCVGGGGGFSPRRRRTGSVYCMPVDIVNPEAESSVLTKETATSLPYPRHVRPHVTRAMCCSCAGNAGYVTEKSKKAVPLHAMKALGGRGDIAPTHDLGTRWGWVVSVTARPRFIPRERTPGTHCTGGWVGPRAGLDTEVRGKILCPCRGSNLDRPVVQPVVRQYTAWASPAPETRMYRQERQKINRYSSLRINKYRYEIQEQKQVPGRYTGLFRELSESTISPRFTMIPIKKFRCKVL